MYCPVDICTEWFLQPSTGSDTTSTKSFDHKGSGRCYRMSVFALLVGHEK